MKKTLIIGLVLIIALVGILTYTLRPATEQTTDARPVVKIGVILPLSGNLAEMGIPMKNAVTMALADLTKKDTKYRYEFIVEDDGFEARKTAVLFHKFKNIDKVDAIITIFSQSGNVISPLAEQNKVLHMAALASDTTAAIGRYNFNYWVSPSNTSGRLLKLFKDKGYKKIASFLANNAGTITLHDAMMKQITPADNFEFKSFMVTPQEKDFRMMLAQSKEFNPDAYLVMLYAANLSAFTKQFHEAGIDAPLTNIESFQMLTNFDGLEGAFFTDASDGNRTFIERYKTEFPDDSIYGIGHLYNSIMITVKAFEEAPEKEGGVDILANLSIYEGVVGNASQKTDGVFETSAELKQIQNGQPVTVEE